MDKIDAELIDRLLNGTPDEGQIVFVQGGIAQYRGGTYYTGMVAPQFTRAITWKVTWWAPVNLRPMLEGIRDVLTPKPQGGSKG